ncbi:MAG: protein kinase, partial [Holophagales bacterium]|nr:protein kinase [Holophagales bacterium]
MSHSTASKGPGEVGPYRLDILLGKGGMGEVYKAFDDRLGRWVAAKRLRRGASKRERYRFRHEARSLARLGHPAIVQIFDIVEDPEGDWIVMELVDGVTLAELRRDGPLDVALVVDFARQIASALAAAHQSGIVHRDLKTENVMVLPADGMASAKALVAGSAVAGADPEDLPAGRIKVLDFGLARSLLPATHDSIRSGGIFTRPEPSISIPGQLLGTPRAMSPEQVLDRDVGPRSDLFSLGVLLYEILTSRSPFKGRRSIETLQRVLHHHPPSVRQLGLRVPRRLSDLVDQLLEKKPDDRPISAAAVEAELKRIEAAFPGIGPAPRAKEESVAPSSGSHEDRRLLRGDPEPHSPGKVSSWKQASTHPGGSRSAGWDEVVVTAILVREMVEPTGDLEPEVVRALERIDAGLLGEYAGREVGARNDVLLLFDRPWSAVRFAVDFHAALAELGLKARIGIHLGEVILHHGSASYPGGGHGGGFEPVEVEGLAKPVARRLLTLASGAQTLLTRAAYEVARRSATGDGEPRLDWCSHGPYRFRGIADEVEVFEVGVAGLAPLEAPAGTATSLRMAGASPPPPEAEAHGHPSYPVPPATLRSWPVLELPEQPYPVLLPYTHPELLAGRDGEIARLWRMLAMPVPVLGLSAPSGTGKSSLLLGGLVPLLRVAGVPTALARHPTEAGLTHRLLGDLLDGAGPATDADPLGFVGRLEEVERLAGTPPVLVLDQLEEILREGSEVARSARARLGPLLAASAARRPGVASPACRWLLVYREEACGRLLVWLSDVLAEARNVDLSSIGMLPPDLSGPERFHASNLPPLATPPPGMGDPLDESTRVFLAAIEKPLEIEGAASGNGADPRSERRFPWRFAPGHAERLARTFARTRLAQPDAPLAPELQVVLAHLLSRAGPNGLITVPEDPGPLVDEALEDHLRRALETAFPAEDPASPTRRARALLALRALATDAGLRADGLQPEALARAIGENGEVILEQLATPLTRLVVMQEAADGPRWSLAHDRMAEAVVRLVEEEGRDGQLLVDAELLELRRFVTLRTALHLEGESKDPTRMPQRRFRRIRENADALLWDDARRRWFAACADQRRADLRRKSGLVAAAVMVLVLIGWGAGSWAQRR